MTMLLTVSNLDNLLNLVTFTNRPDSQPCRIKHQDNGETLTMKGSDTDVIEHLPVFDLA